MNNSDLLTDDEVRTLLRSLQQREQYLYSLWGEFILTPTSKGKASEEISKIRALQEKLVERFNK